jgi:hypothetical protein
MLKVKIRDVSIVDKNPDMELGNLCMGNSRGNYQIDRDLTQEIFYGFLYICGWNNSYIEFKNDVFELNPYCWDEEDEERCSLPNFIYKPEDVTIKWYKYPMRDAYINKPLTLYKFWKMLNHCIESVRAKQ